MPWDVWRRPGAMGCVEETWCHGVCGGDLVPWGVWRRPGAMGCVEETWCHGVCGGDLVPWGVWRGPGAMGYVELCTGLFPYGATSVPILLDIKFHSTQQ